MTFILVLVSIGLQGFALWNLLSKQTFMQTELNTWLCTSRHNHDNVVGTTPVSDRIGYAKTKFPPWPDTLIVGLLISKSKFLRQNDTIK